MAGGLSRRPCPKMPASVHHGRMKSGIHHMLLHAGWRLILNRAFGVNFPFREGCLLVALGLLTIKPHLLGVGIIKCLFECPLLSPPLVLLLMPSTLMSSQATNFSILSAEWWAQIGALTSCPDHQNRVPNLWTSVNHLLPEP